MLSGPAAAGQGRHTLKRDAGGKTLTRLAALPPSPAVRERGYNSFFSPSPKGLVGEGLAASPETNQSRR